MTLTEYYGLPEGANMTLQYSSFYDTVNSNFPVQEKMSNLFIGQDKRNVLKKLTVNTTELNSTFKGCTNLVKIEGIEDWNTSKCVNMQYTFEGCKSLTSLDIANWDVRNVVYMNSIFSNCSSLTSLDISKWNFAKLDNTSFSDAFAACTSLETLSSITLPPTYSFPSYQGPFGYSELTKLVNFGGFIGLKTSLISNYGFIRTPNLSYESCINVLIGLYDFTGHGEIPNSSQGQLKVHQNFLDKVGDEISIGTNKGWTITV